MKRELTHYELRTLITNEVKNMFNNSIKEVSIGYIEQRAKDILNYCQEYNNLPE